MSVKIYHNPRCTKSRQTLELLKQKGIEPEVIEYLKQPLSVQEVSSILDMLQQEPREFMRKKEAVYQEQKLDNPSLAREALIQAITDHPILFERPVVVCHGKAAIGRPPENVVDIL